MLHTSHVLISELRYVSSEYFAVIPEVTLRIRNFFQEKQDSFAIKYSTLLHLNLCLASGRKFLPLFKQISARNKLLLV